MGAEGLFKFLLLTGLFKATLNLNSEICRNWRERKTVRKRNLDKHNELLSNTQKCVLCICNSKPLWCLQIDSHPWTELFPCDLFKFIEIEVVCLQMWGPGIALLQIRLNGFLFHYWNFGLRKLHQEFNHWLGKEIDW